MYIQLGIGVSIGIRCTLDKPYPKTKIEQTLWDIAYLVLWPAFLMSTMYVVLATMGEHLEDIQEILSDN